ncbi:MAG: phosphoglucosamine mutase [Candidatus Lernaella stagnicola]|nr:phosphoglucosamine mutase [Candidatus Lernaella stagnicola]
MGDLFGTDGIRGEANRFPMDSQTAFAVGQALTHWLREQMGNGHRFSIVIGKDTRISGYMLESSLEAGITSMGGDSYLVGVLPTPGIALITESMRADAGIVISASHNPFYDNGIKIFAGNGRKLSDAQEEELAKLILSGNLSEVTPVATDMGRAYRIDDARGRYIQFLKNAFPRDLTMEGMKIAVDVANGATYRTAVGTLRELGAELTVIHDEPNGLNINKECGSQYTEDLEQLVIDTGSHLGLAFDGDGDRLIAVDERGQRITGDQILAICARQMKEEGRLRNDLLVTTVMSNFGLKVACDNLGIRNHRTKVGDRYVLEDMEKLDAVIGGEDSGHMIFCEHHGTGDGTLSALQLIAVMRRTGRPLSELAKVMDVLPQELINVDVTRKPPIEELPEVMAAIADVEAKLGDTGRVLVRYSGTQNMCRVMVEGPTEDETRAYCQQVVDAVEKALA